jgi:hypothetical protein
MSNIKRNVYIFLIAVSLAALCFISGCDVSLQLIPQPREALPLTQNTNLQGYGSLSIPYPEQFKVLEENDEDRVLIGNDFVDVEVLPLRPNFEGYTYEVLCKQIDEFEIMPQTQKTVYLTDANDSEIGGVKIHTAYYYSIGACTSIMYVKYYGDYMVIILANFDDDRDVNEYVATVDSMVANISANISDDAKILIETNEKFVSAPYVPYDFSTLETNSDIDMYQRIKSDMETFTPETLKVDEEHWWISYYTMAKIVTEDNPLLNLFFYDEFAEWYIKTNIPMEGLMGEMDFSLQFAPLWTDEPTSIDEMKTVKAEIEKQANTILAEMPEGLTVYGKYRYLAEIVSGLATYDWSAADAVNGTEGFYTKHFRAASLYGVFIDHNAICGGYSDAYAYLCHKAGLNCRTVGTEDHALSLIELSDGTYYVDTTNGVLKFDNEMFAFTYNDLLSNPWYKEIMGSEDNIATGKLY